MDANCYIDYNRYRVVIRMYKHKTHLNFSWKDNIAIRNSFFRKGVLKSIKPLIGSKDKETNYLGFFMLIKHLKKDRNYAKIINKYENKTS